jgi:endonuclease YncB( thermonuclease family)
VTNLVGRWFELRLTKPGVHVWSVQLDSRGRSLARVYPADQSVFSATLNNFLLDNGLALPYDGEGKRPVWTGEQLGHAKLTAERILAEWQSVTTGTNKT